MAVRAPRYAERAARPSNHSLLAVAPLALSHALLPGGAGFVPTLALSTLGRAASGHLFAEK